MLFGIFAVTTKNKQTTQKSTIDPLLSFLDRRAYILMLNTLNFHFNYATLLSL